MKKCREILFFIGRKKLPIAAVTIALTLITLAVDAQDGKAGIQAADKAVRGYFDVGTKLMYGIGALLAIIGAIKVYSKWSAGDQDTAKTAASWFGACIFLVVVTTIIKGFFQV